MPREPMWRLEPGADPIPQIVARSLELVAEDIAAIRSATGELSAQEANRLTSYLRVLVPLARERRESRVDDDREVSGLSIDELVGLVAELRKDAEPSRG